MATPHIQRPHGWRKWMCLVSGPLFAALGILIILGGVFSDTPQLANIWLGAFFTAACCLATAYYWLLVRRFQLALYPDAIEATFVFGVRRVEKADVTGFTPGKAGDLWHNSVNLQIKGGPKTIEMPIIRTDDPVLQAWFDDVPDLKLQAQIESVDAVLADPQFGHTPDERRATVLRERRIASAVNWMGGGVGAWVAFWPSPYLIAVSVAAILPLAALVLIILLQRRWGLADQMAEDLRPKIDLLFLMPVLGLMLRAIGDYRIIDQSRLLLIGLGCAVLGWLIASALSGKGFGPTLRSAMFAIVFAMYGYAVATIVNVQADNAEWLRYEVDVIASTSDSKSGDLKLAPWGPIADTRSIEVPRWLQERSLAASKVRVDLHPGWLGVRWWIVRPPATARQ